jgi:hypothetical protein
MQQLVNFVFENITLIAVSLVTITLAVYLVIKFTFVKISNNSKNVNKGSGTQNITQNQSSKIK